jgi:tetratricopeptide (TPR) repeat protein
MLASIESFERAIAIDPWFALGHVGIASACAELSEHSRLGRDQLGPRSLEAAAKALALDPELGEAHCAYAHALSVFELDWAGAETSFKRALELSPGFADGYDLYGRLLASLGRFDEAIALQQRAFDLDPLAHRTDVATAYLRAGRAGEGERAARRAIHLAPGDPRPRATLGWALIRQGRTDEGIAELERAVSLTPEENIWSAQLAEAYGLAGKTDRALQILEQLEDPARPAPASPYHLAYVHTGLGNHDRAIDYLEQAHASGTGGIIGIKGSFLFEPLRGHPRFKALLKRMRLD